MLVATANANVPFSVPASDERTLSVDPVDVLRQFRREYLEHYHLLPRGITGDRVFVLCHGRRNSDAIADIENTYSRKAVLEEVSEEVFRAELQRVFAYDDTVGEVIRDLAKQELAGYNHAIDHRPSELDASSSGESPVVRYVNALLRGAWQAGASDLHLQNSATSVAVRQRVDGTMEPLPSPPYEIGSAVTSRIKLMAGLDISERRLPQDGRIRVRLGSDSLEIRVATVPTTTGEDVTLRLLDQGARPSGLSALGMEATLEALYHKAIGRNHGMVLAVGPTGSGKSTTLHASVHARASDAEKIVALEDPVEYHLPGVTQVAINPQAGLTFAAALRSVLRHDPDVIMVGEMRDAETARISVQAALTGHLLLSTVHTTDAVSALVRLMDLGIERFLLAATVEAVLAQRLVRRLCASCLGRSRDSSERCERCRSTGFRGRIGVFELLVVSEAVKAAVSAGADREALWRIARDEGLIPLATDAQAKVNSGLTTSAEIARVLGC